MAKRNDSFVVRYSTGTGRNFGKAKNTSKSLKSLRRIFKQPVVTNERMRDFLKLPDKDQAHLKSAAGWFYRTQIEGKVRNRGSGLPSDMVTLDFDYATPEYLASLLNGEVQTEWEWFLHTSRRHTEEKPRFRLFVFLSEPVPNDLYGPVSRIVAQHFDPDMEHVDKVSFRPAQMMFMPTISKDGEFVFHENNGDLLDWSEMLDIYEATKGDWRNIAQLPQVPDENARETEEKAEDPTEKKGIVGNFCRAYNVMEAIDAFDLPYEEVDDYSGKPRYTFLGGTTTNGAEVQDDGLFLYSHHGSDPTSDMLVNAFDLVRIHKFGHLDEGEDWSDKPMAKRPSFIAMVEMLRSDEKYREQAVKAKFDEDALSSSDFDDIASDPEEGGDEGGDFDDIASPPEELESSDDIDEAEFQSKDPFDRPLRKKPPKGWMTDLRLDQNNNIVSNLPNVSRILDNDGRTRNCLGFNEHLGETVLLRKLDTRLPYVPVFDVKDRINGDLWVERHRDAVRHIFEEENGPGRVGYSMRPTLMDVKAAASVMSHRVEFHPIRDYLNFHREAFAKTGADARETVESLFIRYCHSPDDEYHRMTARKFLTAAVARVFEPGHKFDFSPILYGDQGAHKSTFVAILAQHWFGELSADFSNPQKLLEQMQGCWIMEIPELSSITRAQVEDVKAFLSGTSTKVRMAYAEKADRHMRQQVFMGSTNDAQFLVDDTGNRRWWPIKIVGKINTDLLREEVGMIWGAACQLYLEEREAKPEGFLPLFLDNEEVREQAEEQQMSTTITTETDIWAGRIHTILDKKDFQDEHGFDEIAQRKTCICIAEIMEALDIKLGTNSSMSRIIGKALRKNGWVSVNKAVHFEKYGRQKAFVPSAEVLRRWEKEDLEADIEDLI